MSTEEIAQVAPQVAHLEGLVRRYRRTIIQLKYALAFARADVRRLRQQIVRLDGSRRAGETTGAVNATQPAIEPDDH